MEGTIAQILLFAGTFAPKNWAFCAGQTISIASNTALFSIIGTTYGGNGTTTFQLPDLQGRVPVGIGTGPGLSSINLGQTLGSAQTTLSSANLPAHTHTVMASLAVSSDSPNDDNAVGNVAAVNDNPAFSSLTSNANMAPGTLVVGPNGGNQPFSILKPYLGLNYVICLFGVYPVRP